MIAWLSIFCCGYSGRKFKMSIERSLASVKIDLATSWRENSILVYEAVTPC